MDLLEYLRAFRRRWLVIAATTVVAMTAAWFTTETFAPVAPSAPTYAASTRLATGGVTVGTALLNQEALAVVATLPQVARRVAKTLKFEGDPLELRTRIQASPDTTTGLLTITGFASTSRTAERTADAFASGLIDYLGDRRRRTHSTGIASIQRDIEEAEKEGNLEPIPAYRAELQSLRSESSLPIEISVVHKAIAREVESAGFNPPDSRAVRLALAAVIGLLMGAGLTLVLERVDTKVRTSEQATERFGYPVLAEIPSIPRDQRKGVVTADHPTSPSADAFRLLGAGVHVAVRPPPAEGSASRGRIILVTSSGPAEGKSTVVANLAAVLAEEGKKVIVFSADLRRPTLQDVLHADRKPGLVQAAREREPGIRTYRQWTRLDRVQFVPSGGTTERPGEVLASPGVDHLLREACMAADWVVLDTAPILVAGESAPLIADADLVLVVARSGNISNPIAERTRDTLHRLGADAAWVVLNASRESGVPAGYRRYHVAAKREVKAADRTEASPR